MSEVIAETNSGKSVVPRNEMSLSSKVSHTVVH